MTPPRSTEVNAFRRTLAAGLLTRYLVMAVMAVGTAMLLLPGQNARLGTILLIAAGGAYALFTWQALQIARDAQLIPERIAQGGADEAEKLLTASLRKFTIYPAQRSAELFHLAQLRHVQGRHHDVAALAGAVAGGIAGLRAPPGLQLEARFLELDALLASQRYQEAHRGLITLMNHTLPWQHAARLLASRCQYEYEIGADQHLLHDCMAKAELLGLLPGMAAAESWTRLAAAAKRSLSVDPGSSANAGLSELLFARAVSLAGAPRLTARFPDLGPELLAVSRKLGLA